MVSGNVSCGLTGWGYMAGSDIAYADSHHAAIAEMYVHVCCWRQLDTVWEFGWCHCYGMNMCDARAEKGIGIRETSSIKDPKVQSSTSYEIVKTGKIDIGRSR